MTRAILLDALGTMVELEPPWTHMSRESGIPEAELEPAFRTEMAYYRDHAHEGSDPQALADLRGRCAGLLSRELGREVSVEAMMAAIRFRPYPDASPALAKLRTRGMRLICVSNWDISLPEVLERCGLAAALDGVITSAGVGARKPDPAIFAAGLELAGCPPEEAIHVGDTPEEDVAGASAAGIPHLLLDRAGGGDVASLTEIVQHLRP